MTRNFLQRLSWSVLWKKKFCNVTTKSGFEIGQNGRFLTGPPPPTDGTRMLRTTHFQKALVTHMSEVINKTPSETMKQSDL